MKFIIKNILIICLFCCASSLNAQHTFPYKNPLLPTEERVNDLLNRMTLQEKIAQISHLQSWDVFDGQKLNTAQRNAGRTSALFKPIYWSRHVWVFRVFRQQSHFMEWCMKVLLSIRKIQLQAVHLILHWLMK